MFVADILTVLAHRLNYSWIAFFVFETIAGGIGLMLYFRRLPALFIVILFLSCDKTFDEDFYAEQYEHDTAEDFRFVFELGTEDIADLNAECG